MKNDLISVIVPVYKVEKYLNRCVESIVNQTYKNLEIILVDDGSPDNCPKMCDKWAKKDNRIKVIHKENGGVSSARNIGLDNATGDYIGFVDSDDYLDKKMYEKMYNLLIKENSDVCITNYYIVNEENTIEKAGVIEKPFEILEKELLKTDGIRGYNWNKLYKRNVLEGLYFEPKIKIWEDLMFNYKILSKYDLKYSYNDEPLYYYVQRKSSALHKKNYIEFITELDALEFIISHLSKVNKKMSNKEKAGYILMYENFKRLNTELTKKQLEHYEKTVSKYLKEGILKTNINIITKIKVIMSVYFPNIYNKLKGKHVSKETTNY